MNFSSRYHVFGQSQTEQVRISGMKLVSTRQVLRGEIQKALLTLGEVQATTLPTRLVPRCQAQDLPSSLAAPTVGDHQVRLLPLPTPPTLGLREHGAAPLPQPASCPGAPSILEGAQFWQAGSSPCLGRQAGDLAPGLPSSPAPVLRRHPCQMGRGEAGSLRGHLPRQSGKPGSPGERFVLARKRTRAN